MFFNIARNTHTFFIDAKNSIKFLNCILSLKNDYISNLYKNLQKFVYFCKFFIFQFKKYILIIKWSVIFAKKF